MSNENAAKDPLRSPDMRDRLSKVMPAFAKIVVKEGKEDEFVARVSDIYVHMRSLGGGHTLFHSWGKDMRTPRTYWMFEVLNGFDAIQWHDSQAKLRELGECLGSVVESVDKGACEWIVGDFPPAR